MAFFKDRLDRGLTKRCIMCDGAIEKANLGNICNACRDKMRK
ncbi:MAG: hypothetical protein QXD48_02210 [Candidatus Aenigmatarchaeota archaeon]